MKRTVPLTLLIWLALSLLLLAGNPVTLKGNLIENDDYMRMNQVFDLLNGQGWFDLHQWRLGPDGGTLMHWSRIPDMPIAAVILMAEPWLGRMRAAMVAATVVPMGLMLVTMLVGTWAARPLTDRRWIWLSPVVFMIAYAAIIQMVPGRVDHHDWNMLVSLTLAGSLVRASVLRRPGWVLGVVGGGAVAVGFAIGGEAGPYILIGFGVAALLWCRRGVAMQRYLIGLGLSSIIATVLLAVSTEPLSTLAAGFTDSFSLPTVLVAIAGGTLSLILARWPIPTTLGRRIIVAGVWGFGLLAVVALLYPGLIRGPYQSEGILRWLVYIAEAQPLPRAFADDWWIGAAILWPAVLGLLIGGLGVATESPRRRPAFAITTVFALAPLVLSFVEVRTLPFAALLAFPLVVAGLGRLWRASLLVKPEAAAIGIRVGSLLACLMLSTLMTAPARPPAETGKGAACDVRALAKALGDGTPRVLSSMSLGAELIYRSHASVLAAPYHRDDQGLNAMYDFLTAPNDDAVLALLRRDKIDLLALCMTAPEMRLPLTPDRVLWPQKLDKSVPDWLQPMAGFTDGPLRVWWVMPPAPVAGPLSSPPAP